MGDIKIKKKISVLLSLNLLLLSFLFVTNASSNYEANLFPNILYVDDDGSADYTKIQDAIDDSSNGDIVFVLSGTYYENIVVDKSITLASENKQTTTIDGRSKGDAVSINAEHVNIWGFTITNGKTNDPIDICRAGVRVTASNCTIKENIIKNNQLGIFGLRVTNLTIFENQFYNDGITFSPYENEGRPQIRMKYFIHSIFDNMVNEKPLVYLLNQKNLEIKDTAGQIIAVNCSNVTIKNQELDYTDSGILFAYCSNCIIEKSNISHNEGIWTFKSNNNIIRNNNLSNNFHGITLDYSSNDNLIENNIITNNQLSGVMIEYYSKNNLIQNNNLVNNTFNGYFTQALRNKWNRNYYDDWFGSKHPFFSSFLPKIIVGRVFDSSFPPTIWINLDLKPSKIPYDIDTNN